MDLITLLYALSSVAVVSLISVIASLPFFFRKKIGQRAQIFLLSLSVGALLAVVFFDFLPHIFEQEYTTTTGLVIIGGVMIFFLIEKLIHHHHSAQQESKHSGHGHAYHLGPVNFIGDAVHNFLDGIVIASAFILSPAIGMTTTISVIFHEIPQEIADFGILIYAGYSRNKALLLNFLSALTAILGALVVFMLSESIHSFTEYAIPFACGNFIYIAATNLLPQLHRHCGGRETVEHLIAIALGVAIVIGVSALAGAHVH